jgi:uncharacterized protein YcnI
VRARIALGALVASLAAAAPAAAHVDVLPARVEQGVALELTVRVPTERNLPTTAVHVQFPSQVTVYSFGEPPRGWTVRPELANDGRLRGVTFQGGTIPVGRYADFTMLATPFQSGTVAWKVRQTYQDGQVKPWTGTPVAEGGDAQETGPTSPGPAARMEIVPAGTVVSGAAAGVATAGGGSDDSGAAIWLGVIAIGISALAAVGVGLLWSTRPARLPEDDEEKR